MNDFFELIGGLLCLGVFVCALVVGLAVIARRSRDWLAGVSSETKVPLTHQECPRCHAVLAKYASACACCRWPHPTPEKIREEVALTALHRQLSRYEQSGWLDLEACQALRNALNLQQARLRTSAAEEAPIEAVVVADAVPPPPTPVPAAQPHKDALAALVREAARTVPPPKPSALLTVGERARVYRERQETAASVVEAEAAPAPPPKEHKPLSKLLASFMDEKNIRWGEVVGGLLIVCCSIALVISFWSAIAERPLLKYSLFNGVTMALFGMGLYIHGRWKLPTTSQGLLVISLLLTPLNFLAIAALGQGTASIGVLGVIGELVALGVLAYLSHRAGRVVTPPFALPLAAGVIGLSAAELLIRRIVAPGVEWPALYGAGILALAVYLPTTLYGVWRTGRRETLEESDANTLFKLLGVLSFAFALAAGLALAKTETIFAAARLLAPLGSLAGLPALASGLLLWRRLETKELAGERTAGTAIAVCGAILMVAGLVLGWPQPAVMVVAAAINAIVFIAAARVSRFPAAYLPGAACAVLIYLLGYHLAGGALEWTSTASQVREALLSARSGAVLVAAVVALGAIAVGLVRRQQSAAAFYLGLATAGTALVSLGLTVWFGFGPRGTAESVWVFALYAGAAAFAARLTARPWLAWIASALLLAALVEGLVFEYAEPLDLAHPWIVALLVHGSIQIAIAALLRWTKQKRPVRLLAQPLIRAAALTSLAALVLLGPLVMMEQAAALARYLTWLALLWFVAGYLLKSPQVFAAAQAALVLAIFFGVTAPLQPTAWWRGSPTPWLDPWALQVQAAALALFSGGWLLLRRLTRQFAGQSTFAHVLDAPRPGLERTVLAAALGVGFVLAAYGVLPGAAQELAPRSGGPISLAQAGPIPPRSVPEIRDFEISGLPHEHALDRGGWVLLGCVALGLVVSWWDRFTRWSVLGLLILLTAAMFLAAGRFEPEVAVASAMRWGSALLLVVGSLPIWFRAALSRLAARCAWPEWETQKAQLPRNALTVLLFLALAPLAAMGISVSTLAVLRLPLDTSLVDQVFWLAVVAGVALGMTLLLRTLATGNAHTGQLSTWARQASSLVMILGLAPLLAFGLYLVGTALARSPLVGPEPTSLFARAGAAVSYAAPVLATALVLVGHAIRERSAGLAFAGGLVFNLGATAGYLLAIAKGGLVFDAGQWIRLAQVNALVSSVFALAWLAAVALSRRRNGESYSVGALQATYATLPAALVLIYTLLCGWRLFWDPVLPPAAFAFAADVLGWLTAALALAALGTTIGRVRRIPVAVVAGGLLVLNLLLALAATRWDQGDLLAFHVLLVGVCASSGLLLLGGMKSLRSYRLRLVPRDSVGRWSAALTLLVVVLGMRDFAAHLFHSDAAWWAIGAWLACAVLWVFAGSSIASRGLLYGAAVLLNLATLATWEELGASHYRDLAIPLELLILASSLPAALWLWLEKRFIAPRRQRKGSLPAVHRTAALLPLLLLTLIAGARLSAALNWPLTVEAPAWDWLAVAGVAAALFANLYDREDRLALPGMYWLGLVGIAFGLAQSALEPAMLHSTSVIFLAAYSLATSYLWSVRAGLLVWADRLGIPRKPEGATKTRWLAPVIVGMAVLVVALAFLVQMTTESLQPRLWLAQAALVQAFSVGLLAKGERRSELQYGALLLGVFGAVAFGWAWLDPETSGSLLNRLTMAIAAVSAVIVLYSFGLVKLLKRENEWTRAAQRLVPALVVTVAVAFVCVLSLEVYFYFTLGAVPIGKLALVTIAAAIAGLVAACLAAALLPGRDPLGLSERGRMAYVYAAEALLALEFLHIRITLPWLFRGLFAQYWPLIVMGIAFLGVGFSELFARRRQRVLAEPLERTATFLPLLPIAGFWLVPGEVHYSLLLLSVGALYAVLSILRNSFTFAVTAVIAANGALWYMLHDIDGFGLLEHPQLWLIPPAIAVLAAAYLNRDRLSTEQMTSIRYAAATTIYVSSTADVFVNGVAQNPWLPLVLAALSIAGILFGIYWRVRSFMFLGLAFLVVSLLTIIWHAAVDLQQTWLWYASGIVAGILIIVLFAVFEKKRQEVLGLVEKLKEWEK